ncbi:MAG: dethiobiotin synthase [Alphaproteobacteria bacterium]|nr:dethiobiotin synthase [Alphaproteobacteria bacterium]
MPNLFITSTGTEIGKTLVTAALCHQLRRQGETVTALKPIISGVDQNTMAESDTGVIAKALGLPLTEEVINQISPFRYKAPLAPTMAAEKEGKTLDYDAVIARCQQAMKAEGFTLIEGVGGSFVPLTDDKLVADWIKDLGLKSILVAGSYLGTMSHIIATLEAMQARGLDVIGIVISESPEGDIFANPDLEKTAWEIEKLTKLPVSTIPRISDEDAWREVPPLLQLLKI